MIINDLKLTAGLTEWLSKSSHPAPRHKVSQIGADIHVLRHDGSDLLPHEKTRVLGLVAAHRVDPLKTTNPRES